MTVHGLVLALLGAIAPTESASAAPAVPEAPAAAEGEPLQIDLHWSAPPGCPGRQDVAGDVEALTRRSIRGSGAAVIDGRIDRDGAVFVLHLAGVPGDGSPTRRLEHIDCDVLARAAALMVAVAMAPVQTARGLELRPHEADAAGPDEPSEPLEVADPTVVPASTSIRADPGPQERREPGRAGDRDGTETTASSATRWMHHFLGGVRVGPAIGLVPGPSGAVMGALGWGSGPLRLELVGGHVIRRAADVETNAGVRGSLSGGGLHLLFAPTVGTVLPLIGAGFEAGVLAGRGTGDRVQSRDVRDVWLAIAGIFGVAWPARGRIALRAQAEALIAARRPGMHLDVPDGPIPAFRVPAGGLRVMIGPELRLP